MASSAISFTPATYRFVDGSGYLGRVGEYDSLEQSAGADLAQATVSTQNKLTVVSRGNVMSGSDYSAGTQLTASDWLQVGLFIRSFVQQQDHYKFYAFPVLDVPPGSTTPPRLHYRFDSRPVRFWREATPRECLREGQAAKPAHSLVRERRLASARRRRTTGLSG